MGLSVQLNSLRGQFRTGPPFIRERFVFPLHGLFRATEVDELLNKIRGDSYYD